MRISRTFIGVSILSISVIASLALIVQTKSTSISFAAPRHQQTLENSSETEAAPVVSSFDTRAFAEEIAQSLIEQNPEGPDGTTSELLTSAPEDLINNILVDGAEDILADLFTVEIDSSRITYAQTDTVHDQGAYFAARHSAISDGSINLGDKESILSFTESDFIAVAQALSMIVDRLYEIPVPASLLSIHSEQIRLLSVQRNIFSALSNYNNDALSAWLSISLLEEVSLQLLELREEITDFILTNNIPV